MIRILFILSFILLSTGWAFGQVKLQGDTVNLTQDMKYLNSFSIHQKQDTLTDQLVKNTNLNINQSLKAVYVKNNGFKKEVDYFKSNENVFENEFGRIKINETPRDRIESVLNIILNK
ncbi:hypothetical protein [Chryseobacterium sp. PMSZPI]|uniref:hypothetical protein n=1 Tax=Chryseobacterium sp. PMSZPI TaxID=1033900 RepID=UPI000C32C917|nr:hypothetical protein [Chryseobacterium sp. PMSZPI]PKF74329.1 hypothetical protein CW752_10410 [Chryseobacterium sp. PMSZPI]